VSAAYFLGRRGYKVALVESEQIGSAATGASSGTLFYGSGADFQRTVAQLGLAKAQLLYQATQRSIAELIRLIEREQIVCGLKVPGIITAARDEAEDEYVRGELRASGEVGLAGKLLNGSDMKAIFRGRIFTLGVEHYCAQVHPGQLIAGLSALMNSTLGVDVYEHSPMTRYDGVGQVMVNGERGKIKADRIVIATNIRPLEGLEARFFTEDSVVVPSRPLDGKLHEVFGADRIIQTTEEYYDMLYTQDDRVFLEVYRAKQAREKITAYFPPWVEFDLAGMWGDSWSKTRDLLPILGAVSPNVYAAVAMGDQGIVIGHTCGRLMPDLLEDKHELLLEMISPQRLRGRAA
jgi:hypothetical protein